MIKADKHTIAGILLAVLCVALLSGTGILSPILANGLGNAPRELRLGAELGLIQANQCNNRYLNRAITKKEFVSKTAIIMDMLGVQNCNFSTLCENGIVDSNGQNAAISRKEAVEIMARSTMFMNANGIFNMSNIPASNFRDYTIPEKYKRAMGYMQGKYVVRGLSNNNLGSKRKLTQREAVYFLYRLYEAVSSDMMTAIPNEGICFIDVSLDHPIMDSIKSLTAAGAFDRAILRPSFDGESYIVQDDLTEIVGGIFDRSGKECDMLRLQTIFSDKEEYTTRKQMALILELLLDTFASDKIKTANVSYYDVNEDDAEYQALAKLAGCKINVGYGNRLFSADDKVTWFETVKLIDETLNYAGITSSKKNVDMNAPADKADFDRLKNILISKKAKIRSILGPKKNQEK